MPEPPALGTADGDDVEVSLAVDLSCKFDSTEQQVVSKIMAGRFKSHFLEELPEIDIDWLKDNSLDKDAQDIQAFVRDYNDRKSRLKPAAAKMSAYAKTCWAASSGYTGPKPKAKVVSDTKAASAANRLYAKLTLSSDSLLRAAAPAEVSVFTDTFNGRWRITFTSARAQRSISWTRVGSQTAACLALRWAWGCAQTHSGVAMPAETAAMCDRALAGVDPNLVT